MVFITTCACFLLLTLASRAIGTYQICKPDSCTEDSCTSTPCYNGKCQADGSCICDSCWTGSNCQQFENLNSPQFSSQEYHTDVPANIGSGEVVATVTASDEDVASCTFCRCSVIIYSIVQSDSNSPVSANHLFHIPDVRRGEVRVRSSLVGFAGQNLVIVVKASNPVVLGDSESAATNGSLISIFIHVNQIGEPNNGRGANNYLRQGPFESPFMAHSRSEEAQSSSAHSSVHHRARRAAPVPSEPIPLSLTFFLIKTGIYENVTTIQYGDRIHFQLWVQFPLNNSDINVEIFTTTNDTQVIIVCNPTMSMVGSNLNVPQISPVLDSINNGSYYDHATFTLGTVYNSGLDIANWQASTIIFDWDVLLVSEDAAPAGTVLWVTAGGSYTNDTYVWVGQSSLNLTACNFVPQSPSILAYGNNQVEIGTETTLLFDVFVPFIDTPLTIEVSGPNSTAGISVCSVIAYSFGSNFACINNIYTTTFTPAANGLGNVLAALQFDSLVQAGITDGNTSNTRISFAVTVYALDDASLAVDSAHSLVYTAKFDDDVVLTESFSILVIAPTDTNLNATPAFSVSAQTQNMSLGQMNVFTLTMELPPGTSSSYELEFYMPFNDSQAGMHLCSVEVAYAGVNNPCPGLGVFPVYSNRLNVSGAANDYATWNLGKITNSGVQSTAVDPLCNTIVISIVTQLSVSSSTNTVGSTPWVTVGVKYQPDKLWVTRQLVIINSVDISPTSATDPTFSLTYNFGNGSVPVGGSADVRLTITTQPNTYYNPMTIDFVMPLVNNTPVMSICFAEIISIGRNMPCINQTALNSTFQYSSSLSNITKVPADRATITLGQVCNSNVYPNVSDNQIVIRVIVGVQYSAAQLSDNVYYVGAGVTFSSTRTWTGQIQLAVVKDIALLPPVYPNIMLVREGPDNSTNVELGKSVVYSVVVKLPYGSQTPLTLSLTTTSSTLSICNARFAAAGFGYPCMNQTCSSLYASDKCNSSYSRNAATFAKNSYSLAVSMVTNIATDPLTSTSVFDNSTVQLEFVVSVLQSVGVGSSHPLTVTLEYAGGVQWTHAFTLQTIAPVNVSTMLNYATVPQFNFTVAPFDGPLTTAYSMALGQAVRFQFDVTMPTDSANQLLVSFSTPTTATGIMEISDVIIMSIGQNMPCMVRDNFTVSISSRTGSNYNDIGSINLGYVCQRTINTTDPMANTIRFRAVAKVTRRTTQAMNSAVMFSAGVLVNSDYIYVGQVQITIEAENYLTSTPYNASKIRMVSNSSTNLDWFPAQYYSVPLTVTVPANCSLYGALQVKTPLGASAVATLTNIQVASAGANLALFTRRPAEDYWPVFNSTRSTSQNDSGLLDFGIITHSGITYETGQYTPTDDVFNVIVSFQMADADIANLDTQHNITFTMTLGQSTVAIVVTITAKRTLFEQPDIVLYTTVNCSSYWTSSNKILISSVLYHSNMSTAESKNFSISFFLPGTKPAIADISVSSPKLGGALQLIGGAYGSNFNPTNTLYFTDVIRFSFSLKLTSIRIGPAQMLNFSMPYAVSTMINYRAGAPNSSTTYFSRPLSSVQVLLPLQANTCPSQALGMESGLIQDCQISGSPSPYSGKQPQQCRIGLANGYKTPTSPNSNAQPYLAVNFGNVTRVQQIRTKMIYSTTSSHIISYSVYYSDDGVNWLLGENVTRSSINDSTDSLKSPTNTRQIKLVVVSSSAVLPVEFQTEFVGCVLSPASVANLTLVSAASVCSASTSAAVTPAYGYYTRGFLVISPNIYYCDSNPASNYATSCFLCVLSTSPSVACSWTALPSFVANILGYYSKEGALYALAADKKTYIWSRDDFATWKTITGTKYNASRTSSSWISTLTLSYDYVSGSFDYSTGYSFPGSVIGAKYDGIYYNTFTNKLVDFTAS